MKKKIILSFLSLFIFWNCKNPKENKTPKIEEIKTIDSKAVILIDTIHSEWLKKTYGYEQWTPTNEDLNLMQIILDSAIANNEFDFIKKPIKQNIEKHYRQYIPYLNEKGQKIIEINAFCELLKIPPKEELVDIGVTEWTEMDWKNHYIQVDDGGFCYWKIVLNLDSKEYEDARVNGF